MTVTRQLSPEARQRVQHIAKRGVTDGLPPLVALIAGWLLVAIRVPAGFGSPVNPYTFTRRDSFQYVRIAAHGYLMRFDCHRAPHGALAHVHVCGDVTWFAGYPLTMRAVSVTGISLPTAGLIITWLGWYLTLLMIWLLSDPAPQGPRTRSGTTTRWLCLLLAAFFPGQIYFAGVFPISVATFGVLACCYWSARVPKRSLAALAGVIAGSFYLAAVAVIPGLAIAAIMTKDRKARAAMCWAGGGVAAGVVAVLAYAQVAVGHWNAYFITEHAEYFVGVHDPVLEMVKRYNHFVPLPASAVHRAVAEQGLLVLLLMALALAGFLACVTAGLQAADIILAITTVVLWLIPYVGGGRLAVYRAEAPLVVLVPLLRRLPAWALVIPLAAAIWVAAAIAPQFFTDGLV
jgi:hypothetical protein